MNSNNIAKFMKESSLHISNMNRSLKNIKSDVLVDFICSNPSGITVITNKVAPPSDLQIIKNYIKNVKNIDALTVDVSHLSQLKSYLKIIEIPYYLHDDSQKHLSFSDVEEIIKQNQIFDNIILTSKLQVIKVSSKSDMFIIWVDIWNIQSGSKAKGLINHCFNVGNYITTIRGTNINLSISQCKNYQRWGHATFSCRI